MKDGSSRSSPEEVPFPRKPPYLLSVEQVAAQLGVDAESGLGERIVKERQQKYGPNAVSLPETPIPRIVRSHFILFCLKAED